MSRMKWTTVMTVTLMLVAGCSSSSKTSTTASTTGAPSSTAAGGAARGVTATDVTIDEVVSLTSAQGAALSGFDMGVKARIEAANRQGGVAGRKIKIANVYDDGSDAGKNLDAVKKSVQADKAFAVIGAGPVMLPQSTDYLEQNQVPFVGWGFMPGYCGTKFGFGFNGCLSGNKFGNKSLVNSMADGLGKPVSALKWALQSGDDQAGQTGNKQYAFLITSQGGQVVYNKSDIPTQTQTTDYTPFAQAIMSAKPDVVIVGTAFGDAVALTGTLRGKGFTGALMNYVAYVPGLLQASAQVAQALEGAYVNAQIPPQETQTPAVKLIETDLTAIGEKPFITLGGAIGYWSADVLVHMLAKVGQNLTPSSFESTINGGFTYTPDQSGGIGTLEYPKAHDQAVPCASLIQIKGGKFVPVIPFKCYDNVPLA
jgi:branched-chain amino acid transport system substrate-binding protein